MKRVYTFFLVMCYYTIAVWAQEVTITGTVTGSSAAVSGARVSIKNYPHLVAFTDASGAFTLTGDLPIKNPPDDRTTLYPVVRNNKVLFTTTENTALIRIDLFNLHGSLLYSRTLRNVAPGSHAIPLVKTPQGVHIIRLKLGLTTATIVKITEGTSRLVTGNSISGKHTGSASLSGFIDTLIVVAQGWKHSLAGLTGYNDTVTVDLTVSNPWKPTGALEYEKGMVKIMAKDYDFEMGQPDPNIGGAGMTVSEQPVHTVRFTYDFWMDTTEVTQKQFDTVMQQVYDDYSTPLDWDARYGLGDRFPAYYLYWGNAVLYCNACSKIEGLDTIYSYSGKSAPSGEVCELFDLEFDLSKNGYRLPTEAEWEYACKAGTSTNFYWGKNYNPYPANAADSAEITEKLVWYVNAEAMGEDNPGYGNHEVASKTPNAYGLYDMAGNATEFCHDYWVDSYEYGTAVDPSGPETGDLGHCLRGGNWGFGVEQLRSANRYPLFEPPNYPFFYVGFRIVKPIR
jgi:formylglycine-generating enzyme required for sulfatase activity